MPTSIAAAALAATADVAVADLATGWQLDPGPALLAALGAGGYAVGVRRLRRRGRAWPVGRSLAWAGAMALLVVATQSGLGRYDTERFAVHAAQHALLGMVAPGLAVLGAPLTLAVQAAARPTQRALVDLLHRAPARLLAHPVVAWSLFGLSLWALYLTPLYELSIRNDLVHGAVHLHFLGAGALFAAVAVGLDPLPRRPAPPARLLFVLLAVPVHAFLGLALLSTDEPVAGDEVAAGRTRAEVLDDQRLGAGALWAAGELTGLALGLVVAAQWMADDERRQRREDARLDAERSVTR